MYAYNQEFSVACESGKVVAIKNLMTRLKHDKLPIRPMLYGAAMNGHDRAVKYIVDHCRKSDYAYDGVDKQLKQLLDHAVTNGQTRMGRMLLKLMVIPETDRLRYLHPAIEAGQRRMVNMLMFTFGYKDRVVSDVSDAMEDLGSHGSTVEDIFKLL